jgi:hypothetical protein
MWEEETPGTWGHEFEKELAANIRDLVGRLVGGKYHRVVEADIRRPVLPNRHRIPRRTDLDIPCQNPSILPDHHKIRTLESFSAPSA